MNPGKVVAAPDPGRQPPHRPRLPPRRARVDRPRLLEPGGVRPRRRDVLGRRRLPQDGRRDDVPELHGHPRRGAHHPRPGQRAPAGDVGRPARRRPGERDARTRRSTSASSARRARPSARRTSTWPSSRPSSSTSTTRASRVPLGSLLMGHIHRLNPIGSATAPLANWTLRQPCVQVAAGEGRRDRPPADPAALRRRPPPPLVPPPPARPPRRDAGRRSCCWTTASRRTTTPRSAARRCGCWRRSGYRVELAGLPCCGRPAISKGLLTLGRDLARENVAQLVAPRPRGDADPRLRAELPADPGRRVPRLPPRPRRRPRRRRPRSWSTPSWPTRRASPTSP